MPKRIQLSRKKGWRMPVNAIKVDRTTRWGNPYRVEGPTVEADAVQLFREWLTGEWPELQMRRDWCLLHLHELRGKDLACWCKPGDPCHADVLLELANG